jgi:hypothetical protein
MATTLAKAQGNGSPAQADAPAVVLRPLDLRNVEVTVVGVTEYVSHKWSEKAKRLMLEAQTSKTRKKKEPKDPEADYLGSIYRLPDGKGCGIPASAFKAAIVGACRLFDGLPMTQAKLAITVLGDLVPIKAEPHMREDMVRLETGVADIRYRAGFFPWSAVLPIRFNAGILNIDSLIALVDAAGQGGVGEWRPSAPKSSSGTFGMFEVKR